MFWLDYDFHKFWSVDGTIGYNSRLGDPLQLAQGYVVKDYHLMQRYSDMLNENKTLSGGLNLEYKNPVEGYFTVVSWSYNQNLRNLINQNIYAGRRTVFFGCGETGQPVLFEQFHIQQQLCLFEPED